MGKAWFLPILFLVACQAQPASPPFSTLVPPLITLTESQIITDEWALPRFSNWRVVTSEAGQPLVIIQVAPDEQQIITFASVPQTAPAQPTTTEAIITIEQVLDLAEVKLYLYGTAARSQADALQARLDGLQPDFSSD